MKVEKLVEARKHCDEAMTSVDAAQNVWSECVTNLHLAELNLRKTQHHLRHCWVAVEDALNGDDPAAPTTQERPS